MRTSRITRIVFALAAVLFVTGLRPSAYNLLGWKWGTLQVPFYLNPANADIYESEAIAAIDSAAAAWSQQANTPFAFYRAGFTTSTTVTNNGRNEVFFRDGSNGAAIATTYYWYSGDRALDADIVLWDGVYTFFTGSSGCAGGFYLEDVATHEFGHVVGLGHSSVADATMVSGQGYCSTRQTLSRTRRPARHRSTLSGCCGQPTGGAYHRSRIRSHVRRWQRRDAYRHGAGCGRWRPDLQDRVVLQCAGMAWKRWQRVRVASLGLTHADRERDRLAGADGDGDRRDRHRQSRATIVVWCDLERHRAKGEEATEGRFALVGRVVVGGGYLSERDPESDGGEQRVVYRQHRCQGRRIVQLLRLQLHNERLFQHGGRHVLTKAARRHKGRPPWAGLSCVSRQKSRETEPSPVIRCEADFWRQTCTCFAPLPSKYRRSLPG